MQQLVGNIELYKLEVGRYPENLGALVAAPGGVDKWNGPYAKAPDLKDAWGNDYKYGVPGQGKPFDLVQHAMIESRFCVGYRRCQILEMKDVTGFRIWFAINDDASTKRVAMHACVRRSRRRCWEEVGGLKLKIFVDAHGDGNTGKEGQ